MATTVLITCSSCPNTAVAVLLDDDRTIADDLPMCGDCLATYYAAMDALAESEAFEY